MSDEFNREYVDRVFAALEKRYPRVMFSEGDMIVARDQHSKYVYRLRTGRAGVISYYHNNDLNRVMWVMPGDSIGEIETLLDEKLPFDVVAYEDNTTALRIPKVEYLNLLKSDAALGFDAAKTLARKLAYLATAYGMLLGADARDVLRQFIWRMAKEPVTDFGKAVLPYTRQNIAEYCGISERTANRCIKRMEEENLISLTSGKITVTQEQLERLAEC